MRALAPAPITQTVTDCVRRRGAHALVLALMLLATLACAACGSGTSPGGDGGSAVPTIAPGPPARSSHVVVIVMENKEETQVLGRPDAPFLNRLARRAGVATNSYGVRHPSLPNYIALISGSTQGITNDCTDCSANGPNLADQLEHAHRTWGAYLEGLPAPCARPATAGRYAKKHDPFAYVDAIAADPSRCKRRVPLTHLAGDLRRDRLPDFAFIAPDLCNDTHDCPVQTGDRFLAHLVPGLVPALGPHGFLIITYDEGNSDAGCCGGSHGGRIATVVTGPDIRRGARMNQPIDHYGVLASIEDAFGLPHLAAAGDPRHGSLAPLFRNARVPRLVRGRAS
jgi:phosphatidylinositol-3-phosphatase